MRVLPILAALLCAAPLAKASTSELELLQSRCQEQERQIRQLEEENSRLKSLVSTASKTPAPAQAPAHTEAPAKTETKESKKEETTPKSTAPAKATETTGSYAIVRNGDTLNKVAQRNRTSPEALAELNDLKKPFPIRAGQRLRLPNKPAAAVAKKAKDESEVAAVAKASAPSEKSKSPARTGTHTVKDGETFYSISRRYKMSTAALQAANPGVKATSLHTGQTLQLGAKPAPEASKSAAAAPAKAASTPVKSTEPKELASKSSSKQHDSAKVTELSKPAASSPAAESKPAPAPTPAPVHAPEGALASAPAPTPAAGTSAAKEEPAANGARVRTVAIEETTPLTSFAAAHGTSIARLNALNGLNLNSSTVLAKGSELYVPAQP